MACSEVWTGARVGWICVHCSMKLRSCIATAAWCYVNVQCAVTEFKEISGVGNKMGHICFCCVLLVLIGWVE
jgi:hypothetical protein